MKSKVKSDPRAIARAKIMRIQRSSCYRSFLTPESVDAFGRVKSSAYAGKSLSPACESENAPRM